MTPENTTGNSERSHIKYRGRFAPSPTGPLHFGSLIAAVGSYLQAKYHNGQWLVRMEDLDPPREVPGAADDILRTLEHFGFYWDESVIYQSRRHDAYDEAIDQLRKQELAYFCSCSRKEIIAAAPPGVAGTIYPGTCRNRPAHAAHQYAIRVLTDTHPVTMHDKVQGDVTQNIETESGDFVIKRADGLFAYQLAVVVDDAWQKITEIVRGSDLLLLTPRQIHLQQKLNYQTPDYLHLPIAVNQQGDKLSKQTGAPALDKSSPVRQLCDVMRFLGHTPPAHLEHASINTFWEWAFDAWNPARIPRREKIPLNLSSV